MAGRGISIDILANVRDALQGTGDVEKALADVEATLDDLQRSGDDSTDKMSRGFRDLARDADASADKLERSYKTAYRDTARAADDAADDAVRAQRRLGEASEEVGQEIRQNLGEGIANAARGDFESLADTIGDTLGGAVSGIGGIGAAGLAAAGALGIGALVAAFQLAEENRKKLEERANDLAKAYIDAGSNVLDAMTVAARSSEILTDPERRKEAEQLRDVLGVDLATAVRALAGDQNALAIANKIVQDSETERLDLMRQSANYMSGEFTQAEKARLDQLQSQKTKVDELNGVTKEATSTFDAQQKILRDLVNNASSATKEVDELGNVLYTLPDETQVLIEAQTGKATTDVSKFKGDLDGIPETVTSRVKVLVDDSAWRNWRPNPKTGVIMATRARNLPDWD
ncbi:hypothetical protein [Microbacterium sp.]|uniref:hypothetical protein n=1 Tax=Microbacterium sp. TaxID=51671 RepID=UPI002C9333AA|nr:hypothetical protein [Microbacterium sp.]HWL79246.1 hypothetical protein [Microbacterium sp.]